MKLKEKLITSFFELENEGMLDLDSNIHKIRSKAFADFENKGFPTKNDENWKYTSLKSILNNDYTVFPNNETVLELKDVKKYFIHEIDSYKLVFIDGVYSSFLSDTTHERMDICLMSSALKNTKYKIIIDHYFNTIANRSGSITSLNTAFSRQGAYIHIPKNTIVPKPIQIIHFSTKNEKELLLQPRNLIIVDENSHVQIIERHQSLSDAIVLTNSVTEIFANKRAIVDYYKIQNDTENASLIDQTFIQQKKHSNVSVNTFSFGGKLTRNHLEFHQEGERIDSNLNGITIIGNKQLVDNHTAVFHKYPNCESHELYKGIYADASTGVFNGKVIVRKEAQKTNAFQQNNTILIGKKATINAKPQLEIFADDVKCSHGCTIGQLDEAALFYMQQRGIPKKEAQGLLLYAFSNAVVEKIKIPELKSRITKLIAMKLDVNYCL
ncbi:MAG: Fe-S cluster assembly protein SufD [Flavobacteriaceae bacterium]|nr:Fe-S cluster assembly protein SufD [Flavobacteriaceae bacterium]